MVTCCFLALTRLAEKVRSPKEKQTAGERQRSSGLFTLCCVPVCVSAGQCVMMCVIMGGSVSVCRLR